MKEFKLTSRVCLLKDFVALVGGTIGPKDWSFGQMQSCFGTWKNQDEFPTLDCMCLH